MKTILITGSAGFIGHHVVNYFLRNTDWNIVCMDRLDYSGDLNRLQEILEDLSSSDKKRISIIYHDLKAAINPQLISRTTQTKKVDPNNSKPKEDFPMTQILNL